MLASLERHRTPKGTAEGVRRGARRQRDLLARYGCPHGTLCSELDKRDDGPERDAASSCSSRSTGPSEQFRAMGRRDARDLAVALIAAYQGIALLTNTSATPTDDPRGPPPRALDRLARLSHADHS